MAGHGPDELRVLYPVLVTLEYVPLEDLLSEHINSIVASERLLEQPAVRQLVLLAIKDVEHIEGIISTGANFVDLLQEYIDHPQLSSWPFSNFRINKFPEGVAVNAAVLQRIQSLCARAGYQLFGSRLGD